MSFDTLVIWNSWPILLSGLWLTMLLVVVSLAVAIVTGAIVCAGTMLSSGFAYQLSRSYVGLFRALPETVIVFWLYYCGPLILNVKMSAFQTGVVALAIPSAAYFSEIFRAGIEAVPRGQIEAARAVGLSSFFTFSDVVAPQALRMMIPPGLGILAILIKNSALVSAVGVEELFYNATVLSGQTLRHFELLTATAVIYLALIFPLSLFVQRQESRLLAQQ